MKQKIKVMIIDDSGVVRQTLSRVLASDPAIEVMATASDPFDAVEKMRKKVPDVITLDVEMPRMDGLTFLQKIMTQHPLPVVICSSLAGKKTETALKALEYGAVEVIEKPRVGSKQFLEESKTLICDAIKAASLAKVKPLSLIRRVAPKHNADVVLARPTGKAMLQTTEKVVVIGASTGGTDAIRVVLEALPLDAPGMVIVQHMPETFTAAFAQRLDGLCRVTVKEAEHNDTVLRGRALIAPGNHHLLLKRSGARYYVEVRSGQLVNRHRPSVDVLFRSAARYGGKNTVGVLMTGMGDDGARGMQEMKEEGAVTIAQDEKTSIVFGMPAEAIARGVVDHVLGLDKIAKQMLAACTE